MVSTCLVPGVQDQYPAHQIQAHVPQHGPRTEYKSVPFEGTTTNQDSYKAYAVEPHRAVHAPIVARPHTKFEGLHQWTAVNPAAALRLGMLKCDVLNAVLSKFICCLIPNTVLSFLARSQDVHC